MIKRAQCNLLFELIVRERDRMIFSLVKANKSLGKFVSKLKLVPDSCFRNVIKEYYIKCNHAHDTVFKEWRNKIKTL